MSGTRYQELLKGLKKSSRIQKKEPPLKQWTLSVEKMFNMLRRDLEHIEITDSNFEIVCKLVGEKFKSNPTKAIKSAVLNPTHMIESAVEDGQPALSSYGSLRFFEDRLGLSKNVRIMVAYNSNNEQIECYLHILKNN